MIFLYKMYQFLPFTYQMCVSFCPKTHLTNNMPERCAFFQSCIFRVVLGGQSRFLGSFWGFNSHFYGTRLTTQLTTQLTTHLCFDVKIYILFPFWNHSKTQSILPGSEGAPWKEQNPSKTVVLRGFKAFLSIS